MRELGHVTDPPCREQGLRLSFPLAGLASAQEVAIAGSAGVIRGVAYNEGVGNVGGGIF